MTPAPPPFRVILHVDMDAFYAAIEQRDNPAWRGKPLVVGSPPDQRGVVATASYEARVFGIHSAMPSRDAGKRCPHAIFVPPDMVRYKKVSAQVFDIFKACTPLIEAVSIDEAFLDVTGSRHLFGDGETIARRIQSDIRQQLELTCSIGVAPNKFLAKLGSEYRKPGGLTVMPFEPAAIIAFLRPLPVSSLWGVGRVTGKAFAQAALHTIGDVQDAPPALLESLVGAHKAAHLRALAYGLDDREVEVDIPDKSISREHTFLHDEANRQTLENTLYELVEDVARRLRRDGRLAATGRLKIRWANFTTLTRQRHFPTPTRLEDELQALAAKLFNAIALKHPVRLIGFGVTDFTAEAPEQQLELFQTPARNRERKEKLQNTIDQIREKHGPGAIRRARTL